MAALGGVGLLGSSSLGRAGEGVFLNAATGALLLTRQDEFLAGRGPDAAIARTYNSQGNLDDANNDDWRQSTDRRLFSLTGTVNTAGSTITRVSADGSEITYTYGTWADGAYYRATDGGGAHDKLTHTGGVWTWEEGSTHIKETYAAAETGVWRIATAQDLDGNALTFTYVSGDPTKLDKVTTADGGYIQYTWSGSNITKIETRYTDLATSTPNLLLTRVYYGYDGQNRLTSVTVDLSPTDNATADAKVYTLSYTYDGTSNRVASITQSDGSQLGISYALVGGVYKVSRLTQTVATGETRTTDILYSTATVGSETFDVAEVRVYRDATLTTYVSTTVKSIAGQLREVVQSPAVSGQAAQTFAYTYDSNGNVASITDTSSQRTRLTEYVYDSFGNATQITTKLDGSSTPDTTITRTYLNNNLTQETVTGSNAGSANASLTTRYVYDNENHLRFTISAEGRVTELEYETAGELKRTITYKAAFYTTAGQPGEGAMDTWGDANAANAEVKTFEYDARDGLLRAYGFSAVTSTFAESTSDGRSQINSVYDQSGALLSRWVEGQSSESFVYDGLGRLIASTDLSGGITHIRFVDDYFSSGNAAQTVVTTRAAFSSGSWTATAESLISTSVFNRAGELISKSEAVGAGGATTTVGTETFAYDKMGRLRWTSDATPAARKSYFLYDDLGRKTADVGHDGQLTEYRYDATGRLISTIHYATAISTATIANAANTVVIADVRPAYNSSDIVQWSIYDANDRVVQTIQGDGAVTAYEYDKLGRLVTSKGYYNRVSVTGFSTSPPASPVSVTAHAKDFIVRSFYDGDGRLIGSLNGEGYLTEHIYDAAGRKIRDIAYANATVVGDRASGTFNTLKTSLANASADRSVRYVYDGQGFLRFTIDALGGVTETRYWDGSTLASRQQATGLVRETLAYAATLGSLSAYDYTTVKAAVANLAAAPRVTRFVYNDKAQLVYTVDASGAVTRNWYDASGRLTKSASYSTLYTTAFSADSSAWKGALDAWSPSGDQTRITRYYYTVRNEAAFVVDAEGYVTGYGYDAEGRVTSKSRYSTKLTVDDSWTWSSVNGASKGSARTTTSAYDNLGRLQYVMDAAGRFEYFTYYSNGAMAGKIEGTWADNARTYYYYDQAGKKVQEARASSLASILGSVGSSAAQITTSTGALHSPNGQYRAAINAFGELIIYHNGEATWRSGVSETVAGATYSVVAESNRLVIYRNVSGQASVVIWQAQTGSNSGATLMSLSDTGALSLNTTPQSTIVAQATAAQNPYAAYWLSTSFSYDGFGNVIQTTTPNGQVTNMAYDKAGRIVSRSQVVGAQTLLETWIYDAFDAVRHTDAMGFISYSYFDQLGRLEWAVDPKNYVTQTTYTSFGEVFSSVRYRDPTTTPATRPTLTAGANDAVTRYVYDLLGRVSYIIDSESYVTGTTYNALGQVLSVTRFANTTSTLGPPSTNAADATTEFTYDLLGRVTRNEDALDAAELYAYDAYDRTIVTNRIGGVTTNVYDGSGLLVQETIAAGGGVTIVNKYEYDARGNLSKKLEGWNSTTSTALRATRYEYDKLDRLIAVYHDARDAVTSADGVASAITPTESFYYDKIGNLAGQIDSAGGRTFYWYDGIGRLTHKLAPNGAVTINSYDPNGRLTESKSFATAMTPPTSVTATPPAPTANATLDRTTQYVYDELGRVLEVKTLNVRSASHNGSTLSVDAAAATVSTFYDYDSANNVVRTTDANGAKVHAYFDKLGRKIAEIDAAGYRTSWSYDANSNVTVETRFAGSGTVPTSITTAPPAAPTADAINDRTTQFVYDKLGRRVEETRLAVKVHNDASPGSHTTQSVVIKYTYNALGLITSKKEAIDTVNNAITYTYDQAGRLTAEERAGYTDFEGVSVSPRVEYTYNGLNDLLETRQRGKIAADDRVTTYVYGAGGLLASKTDAAGFKRVYIYDAAGRVRREEFNRLDLSPSATATEAIGYDYDVEGRLTQQGALVRPSGSTTTWTRSKVVAGLETVDTVMMHYNAFGEVYERGINNVFAEKFEYDGAGRLWRSTSGEGAFKYFMYDKAGNQTLLIAAAGTDLDNKTLDYVLGLWTGGTATIATTNVAGVIAVISRYDARNQAIEVLEPQRQRTSSTFDNIRTVRSYNAFGEVARETNALGFDGSGAVIETASITYTYNTMGRLIKRESPQVQVTSTSGATSNLRPTEEYYYDKSGRQVAARDANGNLTRYTLLVGSGFNGAQALATETIAADGGVTRIKYDIHGDARRIENPLYNATTAPQHVRQQVFDKLGRVTQVTQEGGLVQNYEYDGLGQRTKYWNSQLGSSKAELTAYDHQGRITQVTAIGGDITSYTYGWSGSLATAGMGTFGGWTKTTTYANFKTLVESTDVFGRDLSRTDLGGNVSNYTYDKAGRLLQRTGGSTLVYTYYNTGKLKSLAAPAMWSETIVGSGPLGGTELTTSRDTAFEYDKLGNLTQQRTSEAGTFTSNGYYDGEQQWVPPEVTNFARTVSTQNATYDALGRLLTWQDLGYQDTRPRLRVPPTSHVFQYDANGNVRRSLATYRVIDAQGAYASTDTTQDYWYAFDAMNRMTISKGQLVSGQVARGTTGVDITYDLGGRRAYTITAEGGTNKREDFTYDAEGRTIEVKSGTSLTTPGVKRADFTYDLMGRVTLQRDYQTNGTTVLYSRSVTYNDKGQVTSDSTSTLRSSINYVANSTYDYGVIGTNGANSTYALGSPLSITTVNFENGVQKKTNKTVNTYQWRDGAQLSLVEYWPDFTGQPNQKNTSTYVYDVFGGKAQLREVGIVDGRPRSVMFLYDLMGQVIKRDEKDNLSGGDPHEVWYRFSGRQIGYVGNNGSLDTTYANSIANRTATPGSGAFFNGASSSTNAADFDLAYDAVNSYTQGSNAGMYIVQAGDTLSGIAASLWGDSALWYKLAEVNGLTAESELPEGLPLIIPSGVVRDTNNASTFKPYDPNEVMGNLSPTATAPPKKGGGCGVIGTIILVIVAVIVTIWTAGAAAGVFGALATGGSVVGGAVAGGAAAFTAGGLTAAVAAGAGVGGLTLTATGAALAGAIGAAAGSIVSQAIGVMTGIQEKFSWNAVALSAISGGVGGALGASQTVGGMLRTASGGNATVQAGMQSALGNAITQGISVATGLQDKFSWAGVAAAGVSAMAGAHISEHYGDALSGALGPELARGAVSGASAVVNAAARSLIDGSDFGDNVMAALPDVIGQTIGEAIAGGIAQAGERGRLNDTIEALRGVDAFKDMSPAEIRAMASITNRIGAQGGDVAAARARVVNDQNAQNTLIDLLALDRAQAGYASPSSGAARAADGPDLGEDVITVYGRRLTVDFAIGAAQNGIQYIGGLSANDAAAAVSPLRDNIGTARAALGEASPVFLTREVDAFLVGAGNTAREVSRVLDRNPWVGWTLTAIGLAAGPATFAVGAVIGAATAPLVGLAAEASAGRAASLGHSNNTALAIGLGVGALLAIGIGFATVGPRGFQNMLRTADRAIQGLVARGMQMSRGVMQRFGRFLANESGSVGGAAGIFDHLDDLQLVHQNMNLSKFDGLNPNDVFESLFDARVHLGVERTSDTILVAPDGRVFAGNARVAWLSQNGHFTHQDILARIRADAYPRRFLYEPTPLD